MMITISSSISMGMIIIMIRVVIIIIIIRISQGHHPGEEADEQHTNDNTIATITIS